MSFLEGPMHEVLAQISAFAFLSNRPRPSVPRTLYFLGRDPVTGNAYLSLAKMCLYNTDKLSSEALLKKIKTEREDVLF